MVDSPTYLPRNTPLYRWKDGYAVYDPVAAAALVEHLANGHSLRGASGAPDIQLPFASVLRWLATTPAFARMVDIAHARRVNELEARVLITNDAVQAKVLIQALRRAAPEAWDDTRNTPLNDSTSLPQQIIITIASPPQHTPDRPPPAFSPSTSVLQ